MPQKKGATVKLLRLTTAERRRRLKQLQALLPQSVAQFERTALEAALAAELARVGRPERRFQKLSHGTGQR